MDEGYLPLDASYATRAIHECQDPEKWSSRAVVPPITMSANFQLDTSGDIEKGYFYSRFGNPTRDVLEKCLASLDDAKYGLCYSSGLCAVAAVVNLLRAGEHVVCASDVYGGTYYNLAELATERGVEVSFYDISKEKGLADSIRPNTKLVLIESPSNPLGRLVDIRAASAECKKHPGVILAIDNTFQTSYFQKTLAMGVDVVMYSLTKYMNGHSDVIMGAVVTSNDEIYKRLHKQQIYLGIMPSPFDCFLVSRGIKTLAVRLKQHMRNGIHVAKYLQKHPKRNKPVEPCLSDHPQHELLKTQSSGICGIFAFYIKNAGLEEVKKFIASTKVFVNAGSVGAVESLITSPAIVSHFAVPREERLAIGITDNLIRLSVGIEDAEELCKDLDQALWAALNESVNTKVTTD
ncbi:hypothetical protein B566_EDAN010572 [Ephemera danica]|nr:hypothetical protein B566_EDAN010572 [Ephemera danica]